MANKLSKEQRKALIEKAEEDRAKHPKPKSGKSGFATIDEAAEKLENQN
ncbi:hypothetical protein [Secundilactobacillus folii]|nr:hypothetical protein [Secundilactobacillus folii]